MKPTYLSLDDLDSRRELWGLLHRLAPAKRLAALEACCRAVSRPDGTGPRPTPEMARVMVPEAVRCGRADDRLTNTVYADVIALASQYSLDLPAVAVALERAVKTGQAFASCFSPAASRASVASAR